MWQHHFKNQYMNKPGGNRIATETSAPMSSGPLWIKVVAPALPAHSTITPVMHRSHCVGMCGGSSGIGRIGD